MKWVQQMDWYTRDAFTPGTEYVDADGAQCLQFAGLLPSRAALRLPGITEDLLATSDDSEPVLIFVLVQDDVRLTFYSHTRADADLGYSFVSLADGIPDPALWAFAAKPKV